MSVVQSKRGEGQLLVFTKASELATYTIRICSNEKNFPKHYRWCLTSKIVDACFESWKAHAEQGNSYKLVQNMTKFYHELWRA